MSDLDLVPLDVIESWLDQHGIGAGPLTDVTQLTGGTQNILVRFVRDGVSYVLRRGPRHKRDSSDTVMAREATVLNALTGSNVPHPAFVASETENIDLIGSVFYVMRAIDNAFNARVHVPAHIAADPVLQSTMGLTMTDGIVALSEVDYLAVGLADYGKPEGWLERQVDRWKKQLTSYEAVETWPGRSTIPHLDDVTAWLREHQPTSWKPGIMHGDYHLANVMFDSDSAELAAIVDWEMSTIGDPLLDLGQLLASLPSAGEGRVTAPASDLDGFPKRDEVIERYAQGSSRDLSNVNWYQALACYRLGIVLEGSYARFFAGQASEEVGVSLHNTTIGLFEQAARVIAHA